MLGLTVWPYQDQIGKSYEKNIANFDVFDYTFLSTDEKKQQKRGYHSWTFKNVPGKRGTVRFSQVSWELESASKSDQVRQSLLTYGISSFMVNLWSIIKDILWSKTHSKTRKTQFWKQWKIPNFSVVGKVKNNNLRIIALLIFGAAGYKSLSKVVNGPKRQQP